MRTTVAGSVRRRAAMARTLRRTYSRGCSRMGLIISWRLMLSLSTRSARCGVLAGEGASLRFIRRENCLIRAALFIFFDPGFCKTAVADFREDLAHFFPRLLGDDARPSRIIALLGRVAHGVAHIAEAAAVNQINDELELVEAFEISDLWLVSGFRQRFESRLDQLAHTAAEHCLFAEEISFRFLGKRGFQDAGARTAESFGVGQSKRFRGTAGILLDRQERGRSATFRENFANAVAGSFWSDHGDVDSGRRLDGAETNVETVREHQCLARLEIWFDGIAIELGLFGIWNENHDDVGPGSSFRGGIDSQACLLRFGARGAPFVKANADGDAAIAQIERVRVALRTVANDGDLLCLDQGNVRGIVVVEICHLLPLVTGLRSKDYLIRKYLGRRRWRQHSKRTDKNVCPTLTSLPLFRAIQPGLLVAATHRRRGSWKSGQCEPSQARQKAGALRAGHRSCPRCRKLQ